ncbi:MAG: hypothetical protein HeimC3_12000 [Candidatus Heimdallarchaeota archaeon LC_3]|nr:MAG: hypothetical protein HeimC3_12000 [Candidatus Heimdallarchaeota archaeon LC_3]
MNNTEIYSQIPSTISLNNKLSYIKKIHELGIHGISLSSIPSNHDNFQILSLIQREYSLKFGLSIISPLFYRFNSLNKSIQTLVEIMGTDQRLFIALGIGDKITLKKYYPNDKNFFDRFKKSVLQLKNSLKDNDINLELLIAGSGEKMTSFAIENNLGILFNGINLENRKIDDNLANIFIMSHFGDLESIPDNHFRVLIKMLTSITKGETLRLRIDESIITSLKNCLKMKKPINDMKKIVPIDVLNKIGFIGDSDELKEKIASLSNLNLKKIVVSQSPFDQWSSLSSPL